MLKRIFLAALWLPLAALAQSYPSPTYQNVTVLGTLTNTNGVTLASLAQQAANTVLANATGATANVTAFAMPSCSTSASALNWMSGSGFTCNTAVNASQLGGATFASPGSIGSTTPGSGVFTTLSASSTVSGTGFSTYLASPPAIGTTAPAAGKFTTLQATGAFTPSTTAGIVGTTTNDSANAGSVGEFLTNSATSVSISAGTPTNVTSISLTAGDWDVSGLVEFVASAGATATGYTVGLSSTSATFQTITGSFKNTSQLVATFPTGIDVSAVAPKTRFSLSSTTTIYLVGSIGFSGGTATANGYVSARRVR